VRNNSSNRSEKHNSVELNPIAQSRAEELESATRYACFNILKAYRLNVQPSSLTQPNSLQAASTRYVAVTETKYEATPSRSASQPAAITPPPERLASMPVETNGEDDLIHRAEQAVEDAYRGIGLGQTIEELFNDQTA
jgi:hypothetical protein